MEQYNPKEIEQKWAKEWQEKGAWKVDVEKAKKPYYNLMMFPYPSAAGLHVGNVYAFTCSDIHGRFQRMQGFNVFEPMGFDSFGIHSENFAIKQGTHPKEETAKNIKHFTEQLQKLGALFAWDHSVTTSDPSYYKWTQWLFLQLYKAGLAYKAKAPVDWCPSCKTVLANEQVIQGKCERCSSEVIQKELEQWFFKITKYADRLLKNLDTIDWSERTKTAQKNWIGKSEGALLHFPVKDSDTQIEVFTTRPDTLFGATYMVLAPEHPLVEKLQSQITNWQEIEKYQEDSKKKSELERTELNKEKTGVQLQGVYAVNLANKKEIPVFIADYVLASYGTGAIMAVPAHDPRDWEFAKKYNIESIMVVCPNPVGSGVCPVLVEAYTGMGHLVGSGKFDGMSSEQAKEEITKFVGGQKTVKYHVRDWLISRQRYWGPPIPIIYCETCGTVPVPEKDLPVLLPDVQDYQPKGTGQSPLALHESFVHTICPTCKGQAKRETDVSDTFLDSAWYFLRYPSFDKDTVPFDKELTKKWLPVDMYIGGQEHAVLHLLYTRFVTMVLQDLGHISFEEPFKKFRAHGLITKEGAKMSKSKGNVVNPDEYFEQYGADTVRMYLMFIGPMAQAGDWSDKGIVGIYRFLHRVWTAASKAKEGERQEVIAHKAIKKVTIDLQELRYNTAIAGLMEYVNELAEPTKKDIETLLVLLAPFAPYITQELWQQLGNTDSVHSQAWPSFDTKILQQNTVRIVLQVNGKVRDSVEVSTGALEKEVTDFALQSEQIKKWIAGKEPKKIIVVQDRLVNIVV